MPVYKIILPSLQSRTASWTRSFSLQTEWHLDLVLTSVVRQSVKNNGIWILLLNVCFHIREHSHMTSDIFWEFLTYHKVWKSCPLSNVKTKREFLFQTFVAFSQVWTCVTIMCRNDELSLTFFLSYLQKIAKSFSKFLWFPFS